MELDPHLAATMDKIIEDIWMSGSDDLTKLMKFLLSKNISGKTCYECFIEYTDYIKFF